MSGMKKQTTQRSGSEGLTLIELLAGLAAASILAITAGVMLLYVFKTWRQNLDRVYDQQDGTVAIYTIERNVRGAAALDAVMSNAFQVATATGRVMRFFVDATSKQLFHMPDVTDPTHVIRVTDLPVAGLVATPADDGVEVVLDLQGSESPLQTRAVVHFRN